jgi:hypothetical protein
VKIVAQGAGGFALDQIADYLSKAALTGMRISVWKGRNRLGARGVSGQLRKRQPEHYHGDTDKNAGSRPAAPFRLVFQSVAPLVKAI